MANHGVIGATGFVGTKLTTDLIDRGHIVRAIVRTEGTAPEGVQEVALGDFTSSPDWKPALEGLDAVFCLAARVHVMNETADDPLAEFRRMNVTVPMEIAKAAIEANVSRIVFMSSIKVNGEETLAGGKYSAHDEPNPQDPYGVSKFEAEESMQALHDSGDIDVAIIRSPLVYGPGVKGNVLRIMRLADRGLPLPLGSVKNARAMISVANLCDALIAAAEAPRGDKMLALVNDRESLSTTSLLRHLSNGLGKSSRLIPFPPSLLHKALSAIGKEAEATRLLGSLDVEISSTWAGFHWNPPHRTEDEISKMTDWYRSGNNS